MKRSLICASCPHRVQIQREPRHRTHLLVYVRFRPLLKRPLHAHILTLQAYYSTDTFSMNGQCNCGATETQSSSNFGCLTAQGSPVTRRRQLQMDGRKAGIAPQPYFKALRSAASPKRQVIVHPGKDMGILPSVEDLATIQTAASRK